MRKYGVILRECLGEGEGEDGRTNTHVIAANNFTIRYMYKRTCIIQIHISLTYVRIKFYICNINLIRNYM